VRTRQVHTDGRGIGSAMAGVGRLASVGNRRCVVAMRALHHVVDGAHATATRRVDDSGYAHPGTG